MSITRVPTGTAQALSSGQRQALEDFYGALATHDVDLVDQALTSDWEDIPLAPGQAAGPEGVKPIFRMLISAFPDISTEITEVLAEAGRAATRGVVTGTHRGELFGVPASGKFVRFAFHDFHEFEGDRLRRTYHMEDLFGLFAQIGAWPSLNGGGMMLALQIEGYSKQALATLIEMLGRIEIARANAVLQRATTMKTSLTAAAVIATLTLATAHAETVIPHTVIPHIADVSHAETATADFFYRFFTAKSQKNLKKTMSFFSRDLKTYTDSTLGWGLDGFDAVNGIFAKYMPTWPEASMSYPTKVLGGNGSALVQFTDTPELFGGELRIFGAIDIVDGKIVRWVDYWDASSFDKALYQQIKTPADHFPYDYAENVVGEHASPKIQDVAKRLNAALNSPKPGDAASLFASDGVLEDAALRIQVLGSAAIGRYFSRAAHDIPYGLGSKPRHVVGNDQGGGLEWIADPKKGVRVGVSALTLNSAGLIEKMTSVYDTRLLDKAAVSKLVGFVNEP